MGSKYIVNVVFAAANGLSIADSYNILRKYYYNLNKYNTIAFLLYLLYIMSSCTDRKLHNFSLKHYTFINQIFGDVTVREIISDIYPNKTFEFRAESADEDFDDGSDHHIIYDKIKKKKICSVAQGHQNMNKNINDTLCQSYSLMTYFGIKISKLRKNKQIAMCNMYRELLHNKALMDKIDREILQHTANRKLWLDFSVTNKTSYLNMNKAYIIAQTMQVLKRWQDFGYMYFMDEGNCR